MLRQNIYKWHRTLSLIIAIPVVLWAASGFMHPLMTTIRPKLATQLLQPVQLDSSAITTTLADVLSNQALDSFHNFRFVHIDTNWFYQVQATADALPVYFSTRTGKLLRNGDALYAQYLAKQFLEGQSSPVKNKTLYASLSPVAEPALAAADVPIAAPVGSDCCDAATTCVLKNEAGAKATNVTLISSFNKEYKFVNRLLPVYKVDFDRADGIRVYVQTNSDKFAYAVDHQRAVFDQLFALFHNWAWLDALGKFKYIIMALLLSMAFVTTIAGLYIFFITKTKKSAGNAVVAARRNHRWVSVPISLFTLMFSFSGAFHALEKLKEDTRYRFYTKQQISSRLASLNLRQLQKLIQKPITNIGAVEINNHLYWQIATLAAAEGIEAGALKKRTDLMKDKVIALPNIYYVNVATNAVLENGEEVYAQYLAGIFSGNSSKQILAINPITKFEGEYGFVNKRLPVWKVGYAVNNNERCYVETATGKLAARVDDKDLYEGYSFAILHKHHFMDFAGKGVRDFSTMFWAAAQIAVVVVGLVLWRRVVKNKKNKSNFYE